MLYGDHRTLWNICSTLSNNQRGLIFSEGGNLSSRTKTKNLIVFADNTANVIASQLLLILKKDLACPIKKHELVLMFFSCSLCLLGVMPQEERLMIVLCVERFEEFAVVNMHFVILFSTSQTSSRKRSTSKFVFSNRLRPSIKSMNKTHTN